MTTLPIQKAASHTSPARKVSSTCCDRTAGSSARLHARAHGHERLKWKRKEEIFFFFELTICLYLHAPFQHILIALL